MVILDTLKLKLTLLIETFLHQYFFQNFKNYKNRQRQNIEKKMKIQQICIMQVSNRKIQLSEKTFAMPFLQSIQSKKHEHIQKTTELAV